MPKMKTPKSVVKKVRITKRRKVLRRTTGQNHFNAKESGAQTRAKRRDRRIKVRQDEKNILQALST